MNTTTSISNPRVFISSTISDFKDLRSALRFWFEEMGFDVQLSEHNDFDRSKRPDLGSFEACFEAIRQSDYYVLLIGSRRGSLYDEPSGISVTQQEYRTAYGLSPKLKMVIFVRSEVLVALQERSEIAKAMLQQSNSPDAVHSAASPVLLDPEFIKQFVEEVSKQAESSEAVAQREPYPVSNWVAPFSIFRDVTDGLRGAFGISKPLRIEAVLANLQDELERSLALLVEKDTDGTPLPKHWWLNSFQRETQLSKDDISDPHRTLHVSSEQLKDIGRYALTGNTKPDSLSMTALNDAISSGLLLEIDKETGKLRAGKLLAQLYRLNELIKTYTTRYAMVGDGRKWIDDSPVLPGEGFAYWIDAARRANTGQLSSGLVVEVWRITFLVAFHKAQDELFRVLVGLLRYLYGYEEEPFATEAGLSPFEEENARIRSEGIEGEEIREWLTPTSPYLSRMLSDEARAITRDIGGKVRE